MRKAILLAAAAISAQILIPTAGFSWTTYLVRPDGSGDFPNIQAAIDASHTGDTIELADGTFRGDGNRDVDFRGLAITVRSRSGDPEACVIDCEGTEEETYRGFFFLSGEGPQSVLRDITITGALVNGC
jgi:hypothetical protein